MAVSDAKNALIGISSDLIVYNDGDVKGFTELQSELKDALSQSTTDSNWNSVTGGEVYYEPFTSKTEFTASMINDNFTMSKMAEIIEDALRLNLDDMLDQIYSDISGVSGGVTSVNSETGAVILTTGDISEDTNHNYVTDTDLVNLGNLSGVNTGDQDLSPYALKSNVLELDNTTVFTPNSDYEPATKKYVDDSDQVASDFSHNSLSGLNDGTNYEHLTQTEKDNAATGYTHSQITTGNPHSLDKADVGLGNVTNVSTEDLSYDSTSWNGNTNAATKNVIRDKIETMDDAIALNTAKNSYPSADATKVGYITITQDVNLDTLESDVAINNTKVTNATHTGDVTGATTLTISSDAVNDTHIDWGTGINQVSAIDIPIADSSSIITATNIENALQENRNAIDLNTTHRSSDGTDHSNVVLNDAHRVTVTGNPHDVTKTDVGLGNVPNIDCTNASNISSGTLSSSVLPPIALTEVAVYADETTMLAATTQEGDVAVRSDENKSYMHNGGTSGTMSDWTELQIPTDNVLSVNGETGTVVLTTGDISEDADHNYVTDAEKTVIGNTSGVNTGDQDLSPYALKSNVLELDNTTSFTPDADYEPATKKYVDDNISGTSGAGNPSSTPDYVGQKYIDTTGNRIYIAVGTSSSSDWQKQPISADGTETITGGSGDVTVNLDFDWTDGRLIVYLSRLTSEYFLDDSSVKYETTYDALTNASYTDNHNLELLAKTTVADAGVTIRGKTGNLPGMPNAATTTSFTLNDDGTSTRYVKWFITA